MTSKLRSIHKRRQWVPPPPSSLAERLEWAGRYNQPLPMSDYEEAGVMVRTALQGIGPLIAKAFAEVGQALVKIGQSMDQSLGTGPRVDAPPWSNITPLPKAPPLNLPPLPPLDLPLIDAKILPLHRVPKGPPSEGPE